MDRKLTGFKLFDDVKVISKRGSLIKMSDEDYQKFLSKNNTFKIIKINENNETCLLHNGEDMAWFYLNQIVKIN